MRIVGELRRLGIGVLATLVHNVLARAGVPAGPAARPVALGSFLRRHAATTLACDFFTVETVWLKRLYVLVFICIGTRRIEYVACTSNPNSTWMSQHARNLVMDPRRPRLAAALSRPRPRQELSRGFDAVLESAGITVIRTPIQAPNANAHVERWVGSARRECLDRMLIVGRRQLDHILRVYVHHYNGHRPHRALDLETPDVVGTPSACGGPITSAAVIRRRDLLGGLLHEYEAAAA